MLGTLVIAVLSATTIGSLVTYRRRAAQRQSATPRALGSGNTDAVPAAARDTVATERRRGKPDATPQAAAAKGAVRDEADVLQLLRDLHVGDVVVDSVGDAVVVGHTRYREDGVSWVVHDLDAGTSTRQLLVRVEPELELHWLQQAHSVGSAASSASLSGAFS